ANTFLAASLTKEEHAAIRERAGLFDVSHMGRVAVRGGGAEAFLQKLTSNDLARLPPGSGQYTLALNEAGGVRDDLIIFRLEGEWLVVVNAGNRDKIAAHFRAHAGTGVELADRSDELAMIALQGPRAAAVLGSLDAAAPRLERFRIARFRVAGEELWVSRTGYTGEDGFELYPAAARAAAVWDALLAAGAADRVAACGLGARDALRLEVCYPLYGHELDETTTPWEARLGWVVKLDKGEFLGRAALARAREQGPARRLVGFTCAGPVPRQGCALTLGGAPAGMVTSGGYSPCLKTGIGLGYLPRAPEPGEALAVVVRGRPVPVVPVAPPFYGGGSLERAPKGATNGTG
ncbi:MAG: glycine cleavage system aminomethyltransferase GcvT, partial [bacterium]